MRVLVTGATGQIGGATARRLLEAGHAVLGLARTDAAADALRARGITPHRGSLEDLDRLRAGVAAADAVVNAASPMSLGPERGEVERRAVAAMLDALAGTGKRFLYTSDQLVYGPTGDEPAAEDRPLSPLPFVAWRPDVERLVLESAERGIHPLVARPVAVYGHGRDHLVPMLIPDARRRGHAMYVGDGDARWSLVHVDDVADGYLALLERGPAGAVVNLGPERPTPLRELAEAVAVAAGVPGATRSVTLAEAAEVLGPFAEHFTFTLATSPARARALLGWAATRPTLLEEARAGVYGAAAGAARDGRAA